MNKIISLAINDLRNIFRDDILKYFFLAVPLLFIIILVFAVPVLIREFPIVADYTSILISFFALEFPMIIGFVISFMMLDEKDERVFTALRVMPLSLFQFLFYRLFFSVFFTFIFVFIMLYLNGLYELTINQILISSFLFSLITPIVILMEVCFAGNKVTGFTIFKGLNFIFMIPVVSYFITAKWEFAIGVIPSYWPINTLFSFLTNQTNYLEIVISVIYSVLIIFLLSMTFKRSVYHLQ